MAGVYRYLIAPKRLRRISDPYSRFLGELMLKTNHILLVALAVVCAMPSACPAFNFLVDSEFITRDPQTGFRWLDVTNSVNMSYSFVNANTGPGGFFEGFRYATEDEVTLMLQHGGIRTPRYFQQPVPDSVFNDINSVLDMVGVVTATNSGIFLRRTTNGLTSTQGSTSQQRRGVTIETIDWFDEAVVDLASYTGNSFDVNFASPGLGSWLVGTNSPDVGETEGNAFQATSTGGNGEKNFENVSGAGFWWDPPATEMEVATDGASLFVQVGMPVEFPDSDGIYTLTDDTNGSVNLMAGRVLRISNAGCRICDFRD